MNENKSNIKKMAEKELNKICFGKKYLGYKYLTDAIVIVYFERNKMKNLIKNVYPIIAQKYNSKVGSIKSAINRATENMYYDCDEKVLKEFLEEKNDLKKPKTKEIINKIIYYVEKKLKWKNKP